MKKFALKFDGSQNYASLGTMGNFGSNLVPRRTNYVTNPSFESDTPGNGNTPNFWTAYGNNAATYKGVSNVFAEYGSNSYLIDDTGDVGTMDGGMFIQLSGLPIGAKITCSAWVKTDVNVVNANITLDTSQHSAGGSTTGSKNVGANNNSRQSVTITLDSTKVNIFLGLGSFGSSSKGQVYYDGILLEISPNGNPYFDGSTSGASWTGTANASTSQTTANGGIYVKYDIATTYAGGNGVMWGAQIADPGQKLFMRLDSSGTHCFFQVQDTVNNILSGFITKAFNDGYKHILEITADVIQSTIVFKLDGILITTNYSVQNSPTSFGDFTVNIALGGLGTGNPGMIAPISATIDNFQIGTSPSNLYGSYFFDKFPNNCINDFSGKGNNGTLQGSPKPQIVSALKSNRIPNSLKTIKNGRLFLPSKSIPNVI